MRGVANKILQKKLIRNELCVWKMEICLMEVLGLELVLC